MVDELSHETIKQKIEDSIDKLLEYDSYLLKKDVNERSISHKLAIYLQEAFPGWDVDCEYNRNHDDPKRLGVSINTKVKMFNTDAKTVFPDIIIHHRGKDDNLVVMEIKKTSASYSEGFDLCKLDAFKEQLDYKYALLLRIGTGLDKCGYYSLEYR